jgi:hypothetical protein
VTTDLDYLTVAIRNYLDSGNTTQSGSALGILAAFLERMGRHESAATLAGFARSPFTAAAIPDLDAAITHLHDVLGTQTYESLARRGETDLPDASNRADHPLPLSGRKRRGLQTFSGRRQGGARRLSFRLPAAVMSAPPGRPGAGIVRIAHARARSMATGTGLLTMSRTGE